MTPALRSVTLEVLAAATAPGQAAAKLRQQLVEVAAANRGNSSKGGGRAQGGRSSGRSAGRGGSSSNQGGMWEQMLALEAAAAAEVLGKAQVVAATCVGAGGYCQVRLQSSVVGNELLLWHGKHLTSSYGRYQDVPMFH